MSKVDLPTFSRMFREKSHIDTLVSFVRQVNFESPTQLCIPQEDKTITLKVNIVQPLWALEVGKPTLQPNPPLKRNRPWEVSCNPHRNRRLLKHHLISLKWNFNLILPLPKKVKNDTGLSLLSWKQQQGNQPLPTKLTTASQKILYQRIEVRF